MTEKGRGIVSVPYLSVRNTNLTADIIYITGINSKDQMMVFQIMAAILHFGNVRIKDAEGETSEIPVSYMLI